MPISYKNKIYTTLGTPTTLSGDVVSATNSAGVPTKDYTVKGRTIVWNQLRTNQTSSGSGSTSVQYAKIGSAETSLVYGHKYYVRFYVKYGAGNTNNSSVGFKLGNFGYAEFSMAFFPTDSFVLQEQISTLNSSAGAGENRSGFIKYSDSSKVLSIEWKNLQIFDLTQMFGVGNEPATPSEFRAMFPDDYYPYNAGELKSIMPTSVEASTINLLNLVGRKEISSVTVGNRNPTDAYPEIDTHVYYRGVSPNGYLRSYTIVEATVLSSSVIAKTGASPSSINYGVGIPLTVVPSTTYYIKCTTSGVISVGYANSNKIITEFTGNLSGPNISITTPGDCRYILVVFKPNALDTQATFENICISTVQTNEYQPYNKYRANIPSSKYFPDGMKSAGSAYDEINFLSQKAIKRVGVRPYQAGDENNTSFITDKKNTVYALSTPVETAITSPLQALPTYKGFTSFSAPNTLMQNGPLSVTYYAEGGTNPEKGWLTSYKRKLYMGRNIEWNQLVNYNNFQNQVITNGITFVSNGDGLIVANGTCTGDGASYNIIPWTAVNPAAKFLICGCPQGGSEFTYKIWDTNYQSYKDFGEGCVTGDMEAYSIWINIKSGTTVRDLVFKPQFFNLTKMFGAGNEPSTTEEFWSYFDHKLYPYNAGETQPLFKISRKSYIYKEPAGYTVYFADWVWIADTVTITVEYADGSTATLTSQSDVSGKSYSNIVKMTFTDTDSERYVRYKMPANGGSEESLYMMPTVTLVLTADAEIEEIGK